MTEADEYVYNAIQDYFNEHKKYPDQVEVTPKLMQQISRHVFYFHVFDQEEVPCVIVRSQPSMIPRDGCKEVMVPVVEVGDPVKLGKMFTIERRHKYSNLAKQQARIFFYQFCKGMFCRGLRVDNVDEEEEMVSFLPPMFAYRITGFIYGDLDKLQGMAS